MSAEKEQTVPGVLERQCNFIDSIGLALAALSLCTYNLRPLRRAAAREINERMFLSGSHDAVEPTLVVDPRSMQHFHFTQAVGKDHPFAVTVIAVINEALRGFAAFRSGQSSPIHA